MAPRLPLAALLLLAAARAAAPQPATAEAAPPSPEATLSFRPSVAIVVGIFTMMFSLTFLLLMYAKFCHPSAVDHHPLAGDADLPVAGGGGEGGGEGEGGVEKAVVQSLPFFRFAALRGARGGLECAVCLARFEDADLLRLLPRCRHAFHLDCIDQWLAARASCPLCRARVAAADAALGLKYAASARFLPGAGDLSDRFDPAAVSGRDLLDIFVQREPDHAASFRSTASSDAAAAVEAAEEAAPVMDRFKHRIIVSDVVFKSRWSDLTSADLAALDADMLRSVSSRRLAAPPPPPALPPPEGVAITIREEMGRKRLLESKARVVGNSAAALGGGGGAARISAGNGRSASEIVNVPRLRAAGPQPTGAAEERARRLWLPIARRTVRWLAGRERRGGGCGGDGEKGVASGT